jgi:CheY-like chemotaxis protein
MDGYILVVDDDAEFRSFLAEDLSGLGYRVLQAANGREALEQLEDELPALVLLDLKMPVMSGWSVLEALKEIPGARSVPVLVISAYGFEWEAELVGAAGHLPKPVDADLLHSKVESLVGPPLEAVLH